MIKTLAAFLALALLICAPFTSASPIDLASAPSGPIGSRVTYLQEQGSPLDLREAMQAYTAGRFTRSTHEVLNFGIGARPAWVRFDVLNPQPAPVTGRLSVAISWLDQLDIFMVRDGQRVFSQRLGDRQPFAARPVASRFFGVDRKFEPGLTSVYLRVEGVDPMVLPIYLTSIPQAEAREVVEGYTYGLLYGGLFGLLGYNLMLFFSLKSRHYLVYSLYLGTFVLMNMAYTGHAQRYLWPDSPHWQQFAIPLLMMLFIQVGFLFATIFLDTRGVFPRLHRAIVGLCVTIGASELLAVASGSQLGALVVAFCSVVIYSCGMILLGVMALRAGNKSARYYLGANISHISTAAVVALAVSGFIPFTQLAYHTVEVGMMLDAILLAMALADQFRTIQEQKIRAEQLAKIDPLTQMNNRRAFYDLVEPRWNNGVRRGHAMSVIMLDVDHFKAVNDRYGHARGDQVLNAMTRVLLDQVRASDIAARWGGEEFVLFLDETELDVAVGIAERFRHAIADIQLLLGDDTVTITVSMGVAQEKAGETLDDVIHTADERLYMAKALGRDRVCAQEAESRAV
jgi:diguanylate cyclase (GGDEF)-like protein